MEKLSDEQLARLVQASGDAGSYAELVRRHQAPLLAFLYRLAGNDMNVDDISQTAIFQAYRKIRQFRFKSTFRTWLFKIAYLEYLQLLRHRKVVDRLKSNLTALQSEPASVDVDLSMDLQKAMLMLSEQERAAILLCDAHGFSHSEAAQAMNAPLGSVKTYVQRARKKMRELLI
ncbi:MAG: RNA polymerase sigma factor [Parasphingorhabdus sp.]|uniref:RNA polymerase sigma factor n=1 Tax=Parasphingorhabdus sp. TaxID=2709688 RepID=UPI003298EF85